MDVNDTTSQSKTGTLDLKESRTGQTVTCSKSVPIPDQCDNFANIFISSLSHFHFIQPQVYLLNQSAVWHEIFSHI